MKPQRIHKCILFLGIFLTVFLFLPAAGTKADAAVKRLKVSNGKLVNTDGKVVQLKGVSSHGIAWYPQYVNDAAFKTVKGWGCNTFRIAMYTAEYNGYCVGGSDNRTRQKNLIKKAVTYAKKYNMYLIIDWHILSDGNPNKYKSYSLAFFKWAAKLYKDCPNVIFELCNEPNGNVSWSAIKSYAQSVIAAIRGQGSKAICIVGTPTWSQDVDLAAKSPITKYNNVMYSLHFYAGTHKDWLRKKLTAALSKKLPVIVSEFSITDASGNGNVNSSEGNKWMTLLNKHKIGYMMWSLSNKNESSAMIKSSCKKLSGWTSSDLKTAGVWYLNKLKGK